MRRGFRVTTATDADLWAITGQYYREWGHNTNIFWVKGHAEKDGKQADCRKVENRRAGEDAERAYQHMDTPAYKRGYVSQLGSVYGPTTHGRVVVHKKGATVLRHLQKKQYIRHWKTRSRAGAWA